MQKRLVTLFAPQVAQILSHAQTDDAGRWPDLARIAGRGAMRIITTSAVDLDPWRTELLSALGLGASMAHYPQAAVMRFADADDGADGCWLLATPMHFAAGLTDLTPTALEGDSAVGREERTQLAAMLAPHLREAGLDLHEQADGAWLLRSERLLEVETATPAAVVIRGIDAAMPKGRDAAALRRLLTELQMLLHEHPVNLARARRSAPAVNAVWLHGVGAVGRIERHALPEAYGKDAYLRGVYRLHERHAPATASHADELLARMRSSAVAVLTVGTLDDLEARWLAPLLHALRSGSISQLDLVLDRWRLTMDRNALFKFWRGARSPGQWTA
jgi:hypothetical protein